MRHTWIVAGALLLAACGSAQEAPNEEIEVSRAGAMSGGGSGGGMMDGCAMMDGGMGGGGMGGGGMGGSGMGGGDQLAMLGRMIFCDANLSEPRGQSCASCHSPETGFTGPSSSVNATTAVYEGAVAGQFGNRKPPAAAYATPSPELYLDEDTGLFVGGLFWDGRATGWRLHSPAAEQALGPFLNPVEQALPSAGEVVRRICTGMYGQMFRRTFGANACVLDSAAKISASYDKVGLAVAAFEDSPMVNRYSSKYDRYLRGEATLTAEERYGLAVFKGKGNCAACHPADPGADGAPPLFTDNTFDNLGLPPNPQNPAGAAFVDPGLGGFLATVPLYAELAGANLGKHRVPTLRNVDKRPSPGFVKAYGHNGVFKSLKAIVHYYNTRDVLARCETAQRVKPGQTCWPAPEVEANLNTTELGNLKLTERDEDALIAFLKTLSDE